MIISDTDNGVAGNLATRLGLVPGAEAVSTLERQVTGERIRLMAERSTRESVLAALFAIAAAMLLWPGTDLLPLLVWLALTQLPSAARALVARAYRKMSSDVRDSRHPYWAHRFSACSAASGLSWGGIVVLLPSAGSAEAALLLGLHAAYLAFAAGMLTAWLPAFIGFALSSTIAFLGFALVAADALSVQSAVLLSVAGAGSMLCAHAGVRSLTDTLRARLEREERSVRLVAERERAELALEAKERALATANHDLRQPVLALDLYAGLLRSKVRGTGADEVAARIQRSIDALSAMIDSVLDVSTPHADGIDNVPRPVPLDTLLARVAGDHELRARAKGLSLSVEGRTDLIAQVDPALLERVLMNLLGNAIKFTERGGVTVRVAADGERVSLSVRDTGRGIAESECRKIFTEYHQSRQADRAAGQGLGLAIVERLCDLMDVSIELISSPGEGSDFRLSIPRAQPAPACRTALVIDGEHGVLDGMRVPLAEPGWQVTVARTTTEALRRYAEAHDDAVPDVLIVDIGLRGLVRGLDAARRVREEFNADVPVLLSGGAAGDFDTLADESVRVSPETLSPERLRHALAELSPATPSSRAALVRERRPRTCPAGRPTRARERAGDRAHRVRVGPVARRPPAAPR